jgi:potassium large conductance calcium-activated channel subfamily M alpha protein 1
MTITNQLYKQFGIILLALEVAVNGEVRVFLNPSDYLFEDYMHYGYVIADSHPDIDQLQNIKFPENLTRNYNFPAANRYSKK